MIERDAALESAAAWKQRAQQHAAELSDAQVRACACVASLLTCDARQAKLSDLEARAAQSAANTAREWQVRQTCSVTSLLYS
jgi:RNA polymerase-interacting CarD/CdnL/TRCF family regulator